MDAAWNHISELVGVEVVDLPRLNKRDFAISDMHWQYDCWVKRVESPIMV